MRKPTIGDPIAGTQNESRQPGKTGTPINSMTTKSLILYSAHSKLTRRHTRLPYTDVFVRVEKFDGEINKALDKAKPLPGETVLNTIFAHPQIQ